MKRRWVAAALAGTGLAFWYLALPALPATAPSQAGRAFPIRGAIHAHTRRSDGAGTVDDVAAAAARAGLQFVVVTDHGDGSRGPDAPAYRQGVLCIDAVEISTNAGHIVALGIPQSPFPLGGEAAAVLEDIQRMGGMSIVAHADSRRGGLAWRDWKGPFDGIEWLNGDSEWRNESWPSLARALLTYPFRATATLGALLDRPDDLLRRWDQLVQQRRVVAVAASDAHARIAAGGDPYGRALSVPVPSYEQVFRTFSISLPGIQLTRDARADSQRVLNAIREGQLYSSIDAMANPALLDFRAVVDGANHQAIGGELPFNGNVQLAVEANLPPGAMVRLFRAGETVAVASGPVLNHTVTTPGAYRVEIELPGAPGSPPVPWVVSNPIYLGVKRGAGVPPRKDAPASESASAYRDGAANNWRVEKNARSAANLIVVPTVGGTQVLLRYGLGGTLSESPYVAAVVPSGSIARFNQVAFSARAARPMRIAVQLRASDSAADRRWGKSVYLDEEARSVNLPLNELLPTGAATGPPVLEEIRDLLFVVDTVNTKPGTSGQLWIDDVKFER